MRIIENQRENRCNNVAHGKVNPKSVEEFNNDILKDAGLIDLDETLDDN